MSLLMRKITDNCVKKTKQLKKAIGDEDHEALVRIFTSFDDEAWIAFQEWIEALRELESYKAR